MGLERGMQAVVTAAVFNILALIFIVLRCVSRFMVIRKPGLEDYLIIFALIFSMGLTVTIVLQRKHGLGRHSDSVSLQDNEALSKLLYISVIVYNLGLFVVKDSIVYQYLRFFVERMYRLAAWFLIGVICVGGLALLLTACFSCSPVAFFWDRTTIRDGHCINTMAFWFSLSAFNIVTDLAIWFLPMPVLFKLKLPRRQKISLIAAFALGGFGCVTTILRLHALYVASVSTDLTFDNVGAATWSAVELNVGIMCACIPAMRPILGQVFPRLLSNPREDPGHNDPSSPPDDAASYFTGENDVGSTPSSSNKGHGGVGRSVSAAPSFDTTLAPSTSSTRVKQEWSITTKEMGGSIG